MAMLKKSYRPAAAEELRPGRNPFFDPGDLLPENTDSGNRSHISVFEIYCRLHYTTTNFNIKQVFSKSSLCDDGAFFVKRY